MPPPTEFALARTRQSVVLTCRPPGPGRHEGHSRISPSSDTADWQANHAPMNSSALLPVRGQITGYLPGTQLGSVVPQPGATERRCADGCRRLLSASTSTCGFTPYRHRNTRTPSLLPNKHSRRPLGRQRSTGGTSSALPPRVLWVSLSKLRAGDQAHQAEAAVAATRATSRYMANLALPRGIS